MKEKESHYPSDAEYADLDNIKAKRNLILKNLETRLNNLKRIEVRKKLDEKKQKEYNDLIEVINILKKNIQ